MSLEASAYAPDGTPIPRDALIRAAAEAGWVLWPVHDIFQAHRLRPRWDADPTEFSRRG
jgi:hypothetical protein